MSKLTTTCPSCAERLQVSRLTCPGCALQLEGRFDLPELLRLERDDLDFVLEFVRASGSLKDMCKQRGLSYPTIRNRLDDIIAKLAVKPDKLEAKRRKILDAIASGELTVKAATAKLKELES
ncbi:MAG: DUF2089 domain-containing protein [Myxococcaceae bacterium]|nr:DUF2089 domain-containing protein [Myxococcaceae bacterium]